MATLSPRRRPSGLVLVGLVLGFIGIIVLIGPGNIGGHGDIRPIGALVLILGSLSWAIGSFWSRDASLPESGLLTTGMEMLVKPTIADERLWEVVWQVLNVVRILDDPSHAVAGTVEYMDEAIAILGVSRAATKPVWNGKEFAPRLIMPIALSYDHRVIDGATAARFTTYLVSVLSDIRKIIL